MSCFLKRNNFVAGSGYPVIEAAAGALRGGAPHYRGMGGICPHRTSWGIQWIQNFSIAHTFL